MIDLSLILPVHNEETFIESVVSEINKVLAESKIRYEIICVENGSTDNTYRVLKQISNPRVKVIVAPKGYGSAVLNGLNIAKGTYISYMSSNGQFDPKLLLRLYYLIKDNQFDLVKIRRYVRESATREIVSNIYNYIIRIVFKINIQDINGSPRIFLRKWLPVLDLQDRKSFIDTEMAIKIYLLKWRIKEIPTSVLPRKGGKTTVSLKTVFEFIRNILLFRLSKEKYDVIV